jgi:hypothetical protein
MQVLTKCFGTCGSMDKTALGLCYVYITTLRLTPVPPCLTQFVQQQKTTRYLRHFCVNNRHDTHRVFSTHPSRQNNNADATKYLLSNTENKKEKEQEEHDFLLQMPLQPPPPQLTRPECLPPFLSLSLCQ